MPRVKIIAFANNHDEPMLINFIRSLEKFGYDYMIVGKGVKWVNFMTKIEYCLLRCNCLLRILVVQQTDFHTQSISLLSLFRLNRWCSVFR